MAGTFTFDRLLDRFTFRPPLGAGPLRVRDPLTDVPPFTWPGFTPIVDTPNGASVKDTDLDTPEDEAVIVVVDWVVTAGHLIVNVAVVCPEVTMMLDGTETAPLLAAS